MKFPKNLKRYCPKCKKHATQKMELAKKKTMGSVKTMGKGNRSKNRGKAHMGGSGRYSKPPGGGKMAGQKQTKKTDFRYTCTDCKKTSVQASGIRLRKVEFQ